MAAPARQRAYDQEEEECASDSDCVMTSAGDDPKWDPTYRRRIRKQQRTLLNDVTRNRDDYCGTEEVVASLSSLNELHDEVVAGREAAIDAQALYQISSVAREQVERTHDFVHFDSNVFAEKLLTKFRGRRGAEGIDWCALGDEALKCMKVAPSLDFLYGTLEDKPLRKMRRQAHRQREVMPKEAKQPKELVNLDQQEEMTTKGVAVVLQSLKRACEDGRKINFFRFLVDPRSFSQTVENIFHFTFLIKEGRAGMCIEDNNPYIYLPEDVDEAGQSVKQSRRQCIFSLDVELWQRAVAKYGITEPYFTPATNPS